MMNVILTLLPFAQMPSHHFPDLCVAAIPFAFDRAREWGEDGFGRHIASYGNRSILGFNCLPALLSLTMRCNSHFILSCNQFWERLCLPPPEAMSYRNTVWSACFFNLAYNTAVKKGVNRDCPELKYSYGFANSLPFACQWCRGTCCEGTPDAFSSKST